MSDKSYSQDQLKSQLNDSIILAEKLSNNTETYYRKIVSARFILLAVEILNLIFIVFCMIYGNRFNISIYVTILPFSISLAAYVYFVSKMRSFQFDLELESKDLRKMLSMVAELKDIVFSANELTGVEKTLIDFKLSKIDFRERLASKGEFLFGTKIRYSFIMLFVIFVLSTFFTVRNYTGLSGKPITKLSDSSKTDNIHSASQERITLQMSTIWKDNLPILTDNMEEFARLVESMTNHRLNINLNLGKLPTDVAKKYNLKEDGVGPFLSAVKRNEIQILHSSAYYWTKNIPGAVFFSAIPLSYGKTKKEMHDWLYVNGGDSLWKKAYEPFGIVPFECGNTGEQTSGWYKDPIGNTGDLAKLRIRFVGLGADVLEDFHAHCFRKIPPSEIKEYCDNGTLNAAEFTGYYDDFNLKLNTLPKWRAYEGWQEPNTTFELIVNKETLQALPPDLKDSLLKAIRITNIKITDQYEYLNAECRKKMTVYNLPPEVKEALEKKSREIVDNYAERYKNYPVVMQIYKSYCNK